MSSKPAGPAVTGTGRATHLPTNHPEMTMNLGELIARLETADPQQVVQHGFGNPHSYRGDYMDLAFEPATDVTVADMLADARSALGATYEGWKGGDFTMGEHSWCWLSQEGDASGETISALLLDLVLAPAVPVPPPADRAAILTEAADAVAKEREATDVNVAVYPRWDGPQKLALSAAESLLRRLAVEAPTTARPPAVEAVPCMRSEPHPAHLHSGLRKGIAVHGRCPGAPAAGVGQDGAQPQDAFCICSHPRSRHLKVSGRLLCDECDPDSTSNLVCRGFEAL